MKKKISMALIVLVLVLLGAGLCCCGKKEDPASEEVVQSAEPVSEEYPLANVTLGGIPIGEFAIERDVRLAGTSDAADALKEWLLENTGVMPVEDKNAPNRIRLVSDPMLDLDAASAVLENGILTLSINPYGRSIADAVELFCDVLENRSSDELKTINEINSNSEEKHQLKYLNNTYAKLMAGEELNISFIGGSVTYGDKASNPNETSWASLISRRFADTYGVKINRNNVAIGGTGSYFGAFRYEHRVKPKNPDLLFIECAINDAYENMTYDEVVRTSETLVLKAYEQNPNVDIIYVFTFDQNVGALDYPELKAHREVAEKYGLMNVKLSSLFYTHLARTGDRFFDYIADTVHPKDAGYALYADFIWETIQNDFPAEKTAVSMKAHTWDTEPLSTPMLDAHMVFSNEILLEDAEGWVYQDEKSLALGKGYNGRVFANQSGAKLTCTFEGTDLGILYGAGYSKGKISVTVDDGEPVIIDAAHKNDTPKAVPVATFLEDGKHTVVIELLNDKEFEIGALFIN